MPTFFNYPFQSNGFIPHGHCYLWKTGLVWLHIISDATIALAYYSIPFLLIYFISKRKDVPFNGVFLLFGAFIIACGTGHLMEISVIVNLLEPVGFTVIEASQGEEGWEKALAHKPDLIITNLVMPIFGWI